MTAATFETHQDGAGNTPDTPARDSGLIHPSPESAMSPLSSTTTTSTTIWPACERLLAAEISARIRRHAALQLAEARAAERLRELRFVDTRPLLIRSEAFAEDLEEPVSEVGLGPALMRGLAGVAAAGALA